MDQIEDRFDLAQGRAHGSHTPLIHHQGSRYGERAVADQKISLHGDLHPVDLLQGGQGVDDAQQTQALGGHGVEAAAVELLADIHGAKAVFHGDGVESGAGGQGRAQCGPGGRRQKLLQQVHGQLLRGGMPYGDGLLHEVPAVCRGVVDGDLCVEQMQALVLQIQVCQGDGQGGIAVEKRAVGGEDQGGGPGQWQEGPGETARGHRQLHAGKLR